METFPLNNLAEKFEVDRTTMVRAMRGVPPDAVARGNRPKYIDSILSMQRVGYADYAGLRRR